MLTLGNLGFACALGRSGCRVMKREGDGATPVGRWTVREVLYRADRVLRPTTGLRVRAIHPQHGWCDAPDDRNYNRPVRHPYPASAERLWRQDRLYDVVLVLGHNDCPRLRGCGSAIFLHVAAPGYAPTAGCIALARGDLQRLLVHLHGTARVDVLAPPGRKKSARSFRFGRQEHVPGKWRARRYDEARWSAGLAARTQ
jgi:L,D-peptidoglycan transpeptidase YkuD (ErfK/YbiS/YcfS/YnhG family)